MHKEVVIIGASPSGLTCGKYLAMHDKEVLILEKNTVIGPKVCAGGLTSKDIAFGIPETLIEEKFSRNIVHTPHYNTLIKSKNPLVYTVSRHALGQWQAKQAVKAGAEIITEANVTKIQERELLLADGSKIGYEFLVGADGSNSILRRYLGLGSEKLIMAMQYIVPERYDDMEWFLHDKYFGCGYGWIFPHGKYTSIGCGADMKSLSTKQLRENFEKWLKALHIEVKNSRFEAHIINYDYKGSRFGNKFLVGDAGGFTSGLTGEGIYSAMLSGQEIAKLIIDKDSHSENLKKLLNLKKRDERLLDIIKRAGIFRNLHFDLLGLLLKNKSFAERVVRLVEY